MVQIINDEGLDHLVSHQYALLSRMFLLIGKKEQAWEQGKKSFDIFAQMGYMGNESEQPLWDLEEFLNMVANDPMKELLKIEVA